VPSIIASASSSVSPRICRVLLLLRAIVYDVARQHNPAGGRISWDMKH
jgi:hypothetical protein